MNDIEDIVAVKDLSLYYDIGFLVTLFIMIYLLFKLYIKRKNRAPTQEELAIEAYKEIDFSNPKKASYLITKYGYILAKDKKSKDILKELMNDLSRYKYKKDVPDFDEKTIGLYNLFLEVVTNE